MDIKELKGKIFEDNNIETLLEKVGCKNIVNHGKYISCCNADGGDNPSAVQVFNDKFIFINNYTRDIPTSFNNPDIVDLIRFCRNNEMFSKTVKWICDTLGYKFYGGSNKKVETNKNGILSYLSCIKNQIKSIGHENNFLTELSESCLDSFEKHGNILFKKDGISLKTQYEFEIGVDIRTDRITIPIRDEVGTLVGVKGRILRGVIYSYENKYNYIYECKKSLVLYGLHKTYDYIMQDKLVFVVESEKAVMQLWSHGIKNVVSIGGHQISKKQAFIINTLGVDVVMCYDKDINMDEKNTITHKTFFEKECMKFNPSIRVAYMYDQYSRLSEKESPSDRMDYWKEYGIKGDLDVKRKVEKKTQCIIDNIS